MIRFGDVEVDLDRREVRLAGTDQHLEPQAFDLLALLIEHRDRVVSKEELLDTVWGDQFVSESALTTRVKEIRRATGDDGRRQEVIRNIRGRGYHFVAGLRSSPRPGRSERRTFPPTMPMAGRAGELAEVLDRLDGASLITLVGPGGVGKTTLAIAAARSWSARHGDAVFVDLTRLGPNDDPLRALGDSIGATALTEAADLIEVMAGRDAIVVLDNCEHVIDAAASVADQLVASGGPVRLLATSREPLRVPGESVVRLEPLDVATARALFVERARAARADFDPSANDLAEVDRIVAALDRLPLAIEMAAGRISAFSLPDLAALIDDSHDMLESPKRSVEPRHRTLAELIAWSETLLDDEAAATLAHLSVFAGPVPITDITGTLGLLPEPMPSARVASHVAALVDQSLLAHEAIPSPARYRMLETVKAQVGPRRSPAAGAAHAAWYLEVAQLADDSLRTADEHLAVEALSGASAELRAAHRWLRVNDLDGAGELTGALSIYAHSRLWSEPALWAAELEDSGTPAVLAALAADAAERGRYARASELCTATLAAAPLPPRSRLSVLETLADVALFTGDLETAVAYGAELSARAEVDRDHYASAVGMSSQALGLAYQGRIDEALAVVDGFDATSGSATQQAWVHYSRAECIGDRDPGTAMAEYRTAIELGDSLGARYLTSVSRVGLASALARSDDVEIAVELFRSIIDSFQTIGNLTHLATTLRNLIELFERLGYDEPAMVILGALDTPNAKQSFGAEALRLAACRDRVEARRDATTVEAWFDTGVGRGVLWAAATAVAALDAIGTA